MTREFLQLAEKFEVGKHDPSGMYISEKLDGIRVFWDGGITRNMPTDTVPWANIINPKTGERKKKIKPVATGLWSRYGNPIIAPDWWLNCLPAMFLDGELFAGRGKFQTTVSITRRDVPESEAWREVEFGVFGAPGVDRVFMPGTINNSNFTLEIDPAKINAFLADLENNSNLIVPLIEFMHAPNMTFEDEINLLQASLMGGEVCYLHQHTLLPDDREAAEEHMSDYMDAVLERGGEGVMLRDPKSIWTPKRVSSLLKYKPFNDDKGTVVGFVSGRETNKGSKLRGLIGALVLDYKGKRLELSGLTDEERRFGTDDQSSWAYKHPGIEAPYNFQGVHFKIDDEVEFRYRELSDDGVPKEARYLRST